MIEGSGSGAGSESIPLTNMTTCPFILLLGKLFAGCQVRTGDERTRGEVQARVRREAQQGGVRQGAQADALGQFFTFIIT
jgi:hypothetical protein